MIERLALTAEQIQALPDTYSIAAASKAFPADYNPAQPGSAFLPPSVSQPGSAWVNLGVDAGRAPLHSGAPAHTSFFSGRSVFLVFLRLPDGGEATRAYVKQLPRFPELCISNPGGFYPPIVLAGGI